MTQAATVVSALRPWLLFAVACLIMVVIVGCAQSGPPAGFEEVRQVVAGVCQGQGVQGAGIFGGRVPRGIVLLSSSGEEIPWTRSLPRQFYPQDVPSTQLVACVGKERKELMQTCEYKWGSPVQRYWYVRDLRVLEARTGRPIFDGTIEGDPAPACPSTAPVQLQNLSGSSIGIKRVQAYLEAYVYSPLFRALQGASPQVLALAFNSDGSTLSAASADNTITVWDTRSGEMLRGGTKGEIPRQAPIFLWGNKLMVFSPDGTALAATYDKGRVSLTGTGAGFLLEGHSDVVKALAWSPDGSMLATGSHDGTVVVWNARTGEGLRAINSGRNSVEALAWSPDGTTLAAVSGPDTIVLWDAVTGTQLRKLPSRGGTNVTSLSFSPDGAFLMAGLVTNQIVKWEVRSGRELIVWGDKMEFQRALTSLTWSANGRLMAGVRKDYGVLIRDGKRGNPVLLVGTTRELVASFSPDGKLATGSENGSVVLWLVDQ